MLGFIKEEKKDEGLVGRVKEDVFVIVILIVNCVVCNFVRVCVRLLLLLLLYLLL